MDRLLAAGWLESVGFSRHRGFETGWTLKGAERASILKDLVIRFGLDEIDMAPQTFTRACRGEVDPATAGIGDIDPMTRDFWLRCLEELPLEEQSDDLLGLVHLVVGWEPGTVRRPDGLMA
jgi:hypothetical protein